MTKVFNTVCIPEMISDREICHHLLLCLARGTHHITRFPRYPIRNQESQVTHFATIAENCGHGIILLTRDCMAIPELLGFPRRGVQGAYNRQNKGDPGAAWNHFQKMDAQSQTGTPTSKSRAGGERE